MKVSLILLVLSSSILLASGLPTISWTEETWPEGVSDSTEIDTTTEADSTEIESTTEGDSIESGEDKGCKIMLRELIELLHKFLQVGRLNIIHGQNNFINFENRLKRLALFKKSVSKF
jgi:hypothetical protein